MPRLWQRFALECRAAFNFAFIGGRVSANFSCLNRCFARITVVQVLLLSFLFLGGAPRAKAQTDVSGVWASDLAMGDGNILRGYLDLKQNGDQLTGAFWYDILRRPIMKGTITNGKFHIEFLLWEDTPPPIG